MQLLGSRVLRSNSHGATVRLLRNMATAFRLCKVGHQGAPFDCTTKLPSQHTSSLWYGFLNGDLLPLAANFGVEGTARLLQSYYAVAVKVFLC